MFRSELVPRRLTRAEAVDSREGNFPREEGDGRIASGRKTNRPFDATLDDSYVRGLEPDETGLDVRRDGADSFVALSGGRGRRISASFGAGAAEDADAAIAGLRIGTAETAPPKPGASVGPSDRVG